MALDLTQCATDVLAAQDEKPPRLISSPFLDVAIADSYVLQQRVAELRIARGERPIGYKVGCTSPRIQAQVGIQTPIWGRLFAQHELSHPATVELRHFAGLAIEGELAVRLAVDPRDLPSSSQALEKVIQNVQPVIELHHFAIPRAQLQASVLIANNAVHAGFVVADESVPLCELQEPLTISLDGKQVAEVLPQELRHIILNSLAWLRCELPKNSSRPSPATRATVLCGSAAEVFPIAKATQIEVSLGGLAPICCNVNDKLQVA